MNLQDALNTLTDGNELRLMTRHNAADFVRAIAITVEAARLVADGREILWCCIHNEPSWLIDCVSNTDLCDLVPSVMVDAAALISLDTECSESGCSIRRTHFHRDILDGDEVIFIQEDTDTE